MDLYEKLLKEYIRKYGEEAKERLDNEIKQIMRRLWIKREEAIEELYRRVSERKRKAKKENVISFEDIEAYVKHKGIYGIVYLPIDNFEKELYKLGKLLDFIEKNLGEIICVLPNIGITSTSLVLGISSFQGVNGFAIVYKERR